MAASPFSPLPHPAPSRTLTPLIFLIALPKLGVVPHKLPEPFGVFLGDPVKAVYALAPERLEGLRMLFLEILKAPAPPLAFFLKKGPRALPVLALKPLESLPELLPFLPDHFPVGLGVFVFQSAEVLDFLKDGFFS